LDAKALALKDTVHLAWKFFLLAAGHWHRKEPWGCGLLMHPTKRVSQLGEGSTGPRGWEWSGESDGN